jgi:hypothetical protein
MDMESEIVKATHPELENDDHEKEKAGADEDGRLKTLRAGAAPNIACGARSKSFYTQDPKTLEYLKEHVGRQGKCLKDIDEEGSKIDSGGEKYDGPGECSFGHNLFETYANIIPNKIRGPPLV